MCTLILFIPEQRRVFSNSSQKGAMFPTGIRVA